MARRFVITDDTTLEELPPGTEYLEVTVRETGFNGNIGQTKVYEVLNWDRLVNGLNSLYPELSGIQELTIRRVTS
jgi:hypothetical protein